MAISEGIMAMVDMNLDLVGISQDLVVEGRVSITCQIFLLQHIITIQTKASAELIHTKAHLALKTSPITTNQVR